MVAIRDVEVILSRPEFKLIFPPITFPLNIGAVTFYTNHKMPETSFYIPRNPNYDFNWGRSEKFRRVANVKMINWLHNNDEHEGTLYFSNGGAYMLIAQNGSISASGSRGSIGFRNPDLFEDPHTTVTNNYSANTETTSTIKGHTVTQKHRIKSRFEDIIT